MRLRELGQPLAGEEIAQPVAREGELLVDIRAAGICHSDAHYRAGKGTVRLPLVPGHEIAGVVVEGPRAGQRVAIHYLLPGGEMLGKEADGGYAEQIAVPEQNLVPIPEGISFEQAAIMMCSTATAYHALRIAPLQQEEDVLIIGFGGLGISAVQLARAMRAGGIFVLDPIPQKQALARSFGATVVESLDALPPVDVALDLAGHEATTTAALRSLRHDGRLMIVAINLRSMQIDPYRDVLARQRRIAGVADHTLEELHDLMAMAGRGELDLSRAITRRVPLEAAAINEVLDDLDRGTPHLRTVIVRD